MLDPNRVSVRAASPAAAWAIGLIYALAWFLPVIKDGKTLADGVIPGWQALEVALSPLWDEFHGNLLEATLSVCTGLTNIAFVLCSVLLLRRPKSAARSLAKVLLGSAAVNTFWIFEFPTDLRAGYWLWLGAFVLLWLVARARRATEPSAA